MWLRYFQTLYPTRKPADWAQYTQSLRTNLEEPGRLESLQQMMHASKRASEERLGRVTAPVLVLMGSKDPDFKNPETEARWVAEALRGTYELVPGAGHYPHAELPEVTGPRVLQFLHTLEPAEVLAHAA
jgi:pimeloyl-ACP methyl ester carboxylesterase